MIVDFAAQPEAEGPVPRAKHLLRVKRYAKIKGVGRVAMTSSITGAPLVYLSTEAASLTASVGALKLGCDVCELTDDEVAYSARRYITRHGAPHADGRFVVLQPMQAALEGEALDPGALLVGEAEELMPHERRAVDRMNEAHLSAVKIYAEVLLGAASGDWRLASLDLEGLDLVRCDTKGTDFRRLWFHPPLAGHDEIRPRLKELAQLGRVN